MKYIVAFLSLWGALIASPTEFVILVTSFNNEQYVKRNLDSIMNQKSTKPFQVIYVNDQSTDNTGALVDQYKHEHNLTNAELYVVHNEVRLGSGGGNICNTVHKYIPDYKVVVCVDGDDFLPHSGVLKRLEKEYQDPDVWMTYGSFVVIPDGVRWEICGGYSEGTIRNRSFRHDPNVPSHLKTFRAKLFKKIKQEDLINDETGTFYDKAWDMAMMFPMLEMCAGAVNHSRYISDIMYMYNYDNPLSDYQDEGRMEQIRLDRKIRKLPPYEPLASLDEEDYL